MALVEKACGDHLGSALRQPFLDVIFLRLDNNQQRRLEGGPGLAKQTESLEERKRAAVRLNLAEAREWVSGGGSVPTPNTPKAWADMVDGFQAAALQTRLHIPLIYGVDTVHGDGNMYGATVFPHNIGLGASRDPDLVRDVEHVAA